MAEAFSMMVTIRSTNTHEFQMSLRVALWSLAFFQIYFFLCKINEFYVLFSMAHHDEFEIFEKKNR